MKKIICIIFVICLPILSGCDRQELESNAFPLAMGIERGESEAFHTYVAYPDLQDNDALENALSKDIFWEGEMEELLKGTHHLSETSNRNVDLNHLKVLILDQNILEEEEEKEQLISFFREKRDAAWNTYVLLTEGELPEIFSEDTELNVCLGIYLEDVVEGWTNLKRGTLITVGDLMSQYFNQREELMIPIVTVEDKRPIIQEFMRVWKLQCVEKMSMDQVFEEYSSLKNLISE